MEEQNQLLQERKEKQKNIEQEKKVNEIANEWVATSRYQNMSVHLTDVKKDTKSMSFLAIYVQNPGNFCQKVT